MPLHRAARAELRRPYEVRSAIRAVRALSSTAALDISSAESSGGASAKDVASEVEWSETSGGPDGAPLKKTLTHVEAWTVNLRDETWLNGPRPASWWTGVQPEDCPGFDHASGCIRALPTPALTAEDRDSAQSYYDNTWTTFETLFAGINGEEGFFRPPTHGLRHPQIFYYGHTASLYVNKMRVAGLLDAPIDAEFERLFETGVDEMSWDDLSLNDAIWPTVAETHSYRRKVYETVTDYIQSSTTLDGRAVTESDPDWSLFMSCEHDRIHLETSSVLFQELPLQYLQRPAAWAPLHPSAARTASESRADFDASGAGALRSVENVGTVRLGRSPSRTVRSGVRSFGWDVDYGVRSAEVPDFAAADALTSNGEFFEFVKAGGYRDERWWSKEGWGWRHFRNAKNPSFWERDGPQGSFQFKLRAGAFDEIDMQWDWPVEVNHHEAEAFCAWRTARDASAVPFRLAAEAEHAVLRGDVDIANANSNLDHASPCPAKDGSVGPHGHRDAMGNVWEMVSDVLTPFDGFQVHGFYEDFSTPCFDGKHFVQVGGSYISTGQLAEHDSRFHFRKHFLQHSGFRVARSASPDSAVPHVLPEAYYGEEPLSANGAAAASVTAAAGGAANNAAVAQAVGSGAVLGTSGNVYEAESLVEQYLGLHYAAESGRAENAPPILPHEHAPEHALRFPQRVAQLLVDALERERPARPAGRALDVGCAVSGTSFALTEHFDEVVGVDFSNAFIDAAQRMRIESDEQPVTFALPLEGERSVTVRAMHEGALGADRALRERARFVVGDACDLDASVPCSGGEKDMFDGVVMANLLCRLPDPIACLDGIAARVTAGGVVVITTPFTWLDEFTPREKWLGGSVDANGVAEGNSYDGLHSAMEERGFAIENGPMPFPLLIREHQRKYQYIVSEASVWRKAQ